MLVSSFLICFSGIAAFSFAEFEIDEWGLADCHLTQVGTEVHQVFHIKFSPLFQPNWNDVLIKYVQALWQIELIKLLKHK